MTLVKNLEHKNIQLYSSKEAVETYKGRLGLVNLEQQIVKKYFKKGFKILDVGCGRGRTTKPLFDMGYNVVGIDAAEGMVLAAKRDFPDIDFRIGNACNLDFDDSIFDCVFFSFNGIDCIYPESRRIQALKEFHRVLKPNGLLIFSSHNFPLPSAIKVRTLLKFIKFWLINIKKGNVFFRYKLDPLGHGCFTYYYISPKQQKKQLKKIGFALIEIKTRLKGILRPITPAPYYVARKI